MDDSPPDAGTGVGPDRESPGTPRWVKVFGIIALVVVVLFVILLLVKGPGGHGPGRHTQGPSRPSGVVSGHDPSRWVH